MVYMAADNSLSDLADSDLVEMEAVGSDDNLGILVQIDRPYIGAMRYYVGKDTLYKIMDMGIINMCDWQTLRDFMEWGMMFLPAKRYFLILWDHGLGWTFSPRRTFGSDWSSGREMSIASGDLKKAFKSFYDATGKIIHIIGFDACNMQEIEIANEIKEYGKVMIAPQTVWPINGFPYADILFSIRSNPKINEIDLGKKIVDICKSYYSNQPSAISLVSLNNLTELKDLIKETIEDIINSPPAQGLRELRMRVQTVSLINPNPAPEDDYIDLGDFLRLLNNYLNTKETAQLCECYKKTIIKSETWGSGLSKLTGLTTWFPDRYIEFKNLVEEYNLLSYSETGWHKFLNWFYDEDDIRPTTPELFSNSTGTDNNFRLFWKKSFDLAPVSYEVIECTDTMLIFEDNCEDTVNWIFNGFSMVNNFFYEGSTSFFSGNGSNLNNTLISKDNIKIDGIGLLDIYLYYNTEDMVDSFIIEYGTKKIIYYGRSGSWQNCRVILPSGNSPLKFSYHTNEAINYGGVYMDRIKLYQLVSGTFIRTSFIDTTLYIFNKLSGEYHYGVYARDRYGNESNLSNLLTIKLENYATPYSIPNPFAENCEIILDYPDNVNPEVYIYSISGRLVKKFPSSAIINKRVFWDGKDNGNKPVGSGLYFILLKDKNFSSIGKIARQR